MPNLAIKLSDLVVEGFDALGEYIAGYDHWVGAPFPIYFAIRFVATFVFTWFVLMLSCAAIVGIVFATVFALCGDAVRKLYKTSKLDWQAHRSQK